VQTALPCAGRLLRSSKSAPGAYFRRMCSHMDKPTAVTADALKRCAAALGFEINPTSPAT
jgi:hypothetical protein